MSVARIITRHAAHESEALKALSEQLSAAGYEIEIATPGVQSTAAADLVVEFDALPVAEALDAAVRLARESDADVYIAPGLFAQPAMQTHPERDAEPVVESASALDGRINVEGGSGIGSTLKELGTAMGDARVGIRDTVMQMRARAAQAWVKWQQQRAEAAQALRLARERREMELEERRRQHEADLQRRAEEHEQLLAERERLAAEQERALREQLARDAALRAERERWQREEAERIRLQHAEESAAAVASERRESAPPRHLEDPAPLPPAEVSTPVPEPVYADAAPVLRPRVIRQRRHIPTARERQWQRAAFLASIVTLAAMLGFALAAHMRPRSPLPASLIQNEAQQQIPFGPAKMNVSSAGQPAKVAPPLSRPGKPALGSVEGARQGGNVPSQAAPPRAAQKPSAAKPAPQRRVRRVSRESDIVAEDEVIVHHAPTSRAQRAQAQRAQSRPGVRRISDEN